MIVTEKDIQQVPKILDAIQVFQDNQIRCKDMSASVLALRGPANDSAIVQLEKLVGAGNVNNKTLRKVLSTMHNYIVAGAKSGLQIHD